MQASTATTTGQGATSPSKTFNPELDGIDTKGEAKNMCKFKSQQFLVSILANFDFASDLI